ncbi:MAG: triple tyrosine motif-containing protein [Salinivirgaceae bacterium]|nr:triple tyrosine motif-containing protein [Salinivirgaceae bacterium]
MFGIPFITNYTKNEIGISSQNHSIVQDSRGIIYLANDYGILEFDGSNWTIIQNATNGSNVKSLAIDNNDRLYAGAQGDFGYLDYHDEYKLIFKSLIDKIPEKYRNFGDVWQTHVTSQGIVFHSWDATYIYSNDTIQVIDFKELSKESFLVRDTVYIQAHNGLYKLDDGNLSKVPFLDYFSDKEVSFMLPHGNSDFLIGTKFNGLFIANKFSINPFSIKGIIPLKNFQLNKGLLLKNGNFILTTIQNGILFIDSNGKLLNFLHKYNGLQSNAASSLFSDKSGNLWLGSNGVDFIETSSPFSVIHINKDEEHATYASLRFNNKLYVATHHGLYYSEWSELTKSLDKSATFKRQEGLPDIIWNLQIIDDELIISTEIGFYQLLNNKTKLIAKTEGAWLLQKFSNHKNLYLGGTYTGLVLLKKINNNWFFHSNLKGFNESTRVMEQDNLGNIWTSHGYKGTFKLKINNKLDSIEKISFYDIQKGFPSSIYTGVYKINNELVFTSQYGFYKYDDIADSMIIHPFYGSKVGTSEHVRYLKQNKQKTWYIYGDETGYIEKYADGSYSVASSHFNKLAEYYIPGFENFWFLPNSDGIIGTKQDLIYYNASIKNDYNKAFNSLLRRVECPINNSIIYDDRYEFLCDTVINQNPKIEYIYNNIIFRFSASFYENIKNLTFSYYLEGFDKNWSEWGAENHKEYTNLPEGEYTFRLKAKNIYNIESNETTFTLTILPPWYRETWAYIIYALLFIGFIILIFKLRGIQLQKEKTVFIEEQLKKRELQEAKHSEEKLKNELLTKSTELASLASNVIYKNERISEIKQKLSELTPIAADKVSKKLTKVLAFIENELEDDNWENFEYRFNQAHNNFIKRFKATYPELTPKDLKFCAYLRMNLSTKEIAQLLNMTIRGVENAKYRIRKRVELDSNDNLTNFVISF